MCLGSCALVSMPRAWLAHCVNWLQNQFVLTRGLCVLQWDHDPGPHLRKNSRAQRTGIGRRRYVSRNPCQYNSWCLRNVVVIVIHTVPWSTPKVPPPRCAQWNRCDLQRSQRHIEQLTASPPVPDTYSEVEATYATLCPHVLTAMNTVNEAKPDRPRSSCDITDWTSVVRQLAKPAKRRSKIFYRRVKHTLLSPRAQSTLPVHNLITHGLQRPASIYPSGRNWTTRHLPRMMICVHSRKPPEKSLPGQTAYPRIYCPYSLLPHLPLCMLASHCVIKQVIYTSHGSCLKPSACTKAKGLGRTQIGRNPSQ